ncbi:MAG: GNAT family N-acetyltransferase, partial [Candidatus Omnitrophica bacterium]|nr:GNAT family N-acetyltransferase [Candidatus Omnitrophota bacterium]
VRSKAEISAVAIFFRWQDKGHYHLSASHERFQRFRPNNFLIYQTALYMKEKGIRQLHLGGGTTPEEDNGLFRFKVRFSPFLASFFTGGAVIDHDLYRMACEMWMARYPEKISKYGGRILKYRY